jgi:type I restriction enzyme, R subunit
MTYTERNFEDHIEYELVESGYKKRKTESYDKDLCSISEDLIGFIKDTQLKQYEKLENQYGPQTEEKLLKRISDEIEKRGLIDVLRRGVKDRGSSFQLVYFEPKSGLNPEHRELYEQNRFTVVRQLKFSQRNENSVDMGLFVNGIPVSVLELKNSLTGQTHVDAEKQYREDRDPKEPLFRFKRCLVFFAVGNEKVSMTTRLSGQKTRFLPYNKDIENPVNPDDHKTSYLWEDILQPDSLLDLIENFVHVREEIEKVYDPKTKRIVDEKSEILVFPRYHQLRVVRKLKKTVVEEGPGHKYLIQHTTGSGKSLSIGWLSHLLTSLYQNPEDTNRMFDSVIVVTDRKVLDKQIQNTIKQLEQTKGVVNPVDVNSEQLKQFIEDGKHIIITTIQKFPVISNAIGEMTGRKFAVVIDEVHSSQSGRSANELRRSLSKSSLDEYQEGEDTEDLTDIDTLILKEMETHGKQTHISFFGFSGTPKNKTLEIFGRKNDVGQFIPFEVYSMKQSIAEQFTLDVLNNYTTYKRYFRLNQEISDDSEVDTRRVKRMLVNWVDIHPHTITEKTQIILDHFKSKTGNKMEGKARGMVVTRSRLHCVKFKLEFDKQMKEMGLPYQAIVGFSGKVIDQDSGQEYTESSMNGFSESETEQRLKYPENRILIVNNKFQTGFDEPMLHTMYVDKKLGGLQGVQTLSRLNRTMSGKTDTFVLDFVNDPDDIQESFQPYYQGTVLTEETDPNHLYTVQQEIEKHHLYHDEIVENFVTTFYDEMIPDEKLQGILDTVVESWRELDRDDQEDFRGNVQSFIRLYGYIVQIVDFKDLELEKLYIFLRHLVKKLPRRPGDDIRDVTSFVDLEYFRIEKKHETKIELAEEDGELDPMGADTIGLPPEEVKELLSDIIRVINDSYGTNLTEEDKVRLEELQRLIQENEEFRKVYEGDNTETGRRHVFDRVFEDVKLGLVERDLDFYNKISNPNTSRYLKDRLYQSYSTPAD